MKNKLGDEIATHISGGFIDYVQELVGDAVLECIDIMKDHITASAWNYEKDEPVNVKIKFEA